jgi:hypothetical protein
MTPCPLCESPTSAVICADCLDKVLDKDLAKLREEVRNGVRDETGLSLTDEQLDEVLADPSVLSNVKAFGASDTEVRSMIADFLSQKIMGRRWPTYGESEDSLKSFFNEYPGRAAALGYKIHTP